MALVQTRASRGAVGSESGMLRTHHKESFQWRAAFFA